MAKRPRFSRWRRLPPVFRTGEHRPIGTGNEIDRLILYLPARSLDLAEALAEKAGIPAIQDYCELLLNQALEAERDRQKVIEFETRRGPLEGLKQIASDPAYLTEWQHEVDTRPSPPPPPAVDALSVDFVLAEEAEAEERFEAAARSGFSPEAEPYAQAGLPPADEAQDIAWVDEGASAGEPVESDEVAPGGFRIEPASLPAPPPPVRPTVRAAADPEAVEIVRRHAGFSREERGFLPCLRRGVPVPPVQSNELIRALNQLELEHRDATVIDRRLSHALHRLALESQVLLTDAWPGVFDARMIAVIRAVQESVERILSGQDIRYYPRNAAKPAAPEPPH
ncbi:MAG: hypothetical protein ACYC61_07855 [Isosphaeraceae bacterium]